MKMKTLLYLICIAFVSAILFSSCKSGEKQPAATGEDTIAVVPEKTAADVCTLDNKIAITIKGYGYGMSDKKYEYLDTNFNVVQSTWKIKNDSVAELKLSNYKMEELVGDRKDNQVDIVVELRAKNGNSLKPATYPYMEYQEDFNSSVTMNTAKGTVYFNWVMGMPEQGDVTIDFIDDNNVCGSFALNVEKPESETIGVVRLNGTFKVSK
ncbi:MAG: hypothetical protein JXB49_34325 [Bacteroidales bacterium]|nr:hypothetical protein [Bacteroidales bacterium]